jgi:hypothetical protein
VRLQVPTVIPGLTVASPLWVSAESASPIEQTWWWT